MMRITIEDTGLEVGIVVSSSGGYSPDVMSDLRARALEIYERSLAVKMAAASIEGDEQ